MLKISGNTVDPETIMESLNNDEIKLQILKTINTSTNIYNYSSNEELLFVLDMRKNLVKASKMLYRSRMRFRIFNESECNERFGKERKKVVFR
jgi:protein-glutamine gamma-glutamyltransferase